MQSLELLVSMGQDQPINCNNKQTTMPLMYKPHAPYSMHHTACESRLQAASRHHHIPPSALNLHTPVTLAWVIWVLVTALRAIFQVLALAAEQLIAGGACMVDVCDRPMLH
jgi:hypothetical protein